MEGCSQLRKDDPDLLREQMQERSNHRKNGSKHFEASVGQGSSSYSFGELFDSSLALQLKRDEALAWALQDAYDQEQFMMMLQESDEIPVMQTIDSQSDIDPDAMSYEERVALGEALGSQNVGLTPEEIAMLKAIKFKNCPLEDKDVQCVICQEPFEKQAYVIILSCKHLYHADCVRQWLEIKKVCPVCNVEVVLRKLK